MVCEVKELLDYARDHWLPLVLVVGTAAAFIWVYINKYKLQLIKKK